LHFLDADGLPGEDRAEIDLFRPREIRPGLTAVKSIS
jgi:hypothetical protein